MFNLSDKVFLLNWKRFTFWTECAVLELQKISFIAYEINFCESALVTWHPGTKV